jgi:hypothetical protein
VGVDIDLHPLPFLCLIRVPDSGLGYFYSEKDGQDMSNDDHMIAWLKSSFTGRRPPTNFKTENQDENFHKARYERLMSRDIKDIRHALSFDTTFVE